MKTFLAILLVVGVVHNTSILAAGTTTPSTSPLLGSWTVDISRMPMSAAARPKRVTITFNDAGNSKWTMQVDIIDANGSEGKVEGTYALDGSTVPIQGYAEADVGAVQHPAPNVLILALGKSGMPASTRVYTLDPDGKRLIETAVSTAGNGLPLMRKNYFSRVK